MYIDTHNVDNMKKSICNILEIDDAELVKTLKQACLLSQNIGWFDGAKFDSILEEFLAKITPKEPIDEILFFHLGRRLNDAENDHAGRNLKELLITQNSFSDFLKRFEIEFKDEGNRLNMYYKKKLYAIDEHQAGHLLYRLGYYDNGKDYCFNGFAFKDSICKNDYYRRLFGCPEIIGEIAACLNNQNIILEYMKESQYYCYEYCLPLDKVIFDGNNQDESIESKRLYLIKKVLYRILEYNGNDYNDITDSDNPILRLGDDETMDDRYYICKECLT